MNDPTLNPCNEPGPIQDTNIDSAPPFCRDGKKISSSGTITDKPYLENQEDVLSKDMSWLEDATMSKLGNGSPALCDPQQSGHIINEQGMSPPNRNVVYRYAKSIRGTDEAMRGMFKDLVVIDESGKAHNVPIIWGTQERAVSYITFI